MATILTDATLKEALQQNEIVVVDFWAQWCAPCRMLAPIIEGVAAEFTGKALVGKLDVDTYKDVALEYGIRGIPTVLFFKKGQLVDRTVGNVTKLTLEEKITTLLKAE